MGCLLGAALLLVCSVSAVVFVLVLPSLNVAFGLLTGAHAAAAPTIDLI